ncbi:Uncharacterised protein [Myroides odoratus]|uniref:Uncharacterized protein n=1 Tax=Myroides odoratus TaxID=256 RepID=A0A378U3Y2_MYROD|nr:Uncharacterised protein [Myroides odoratus]
MHGLFFYGVLGMGYEVKVMRLNKPHKGQTSQRANLTKGKSHKEQTSQRTNLP